VGLIRKGMSVEINNDFLMVNREQIITELKEYYEASIDLCGIDDDINTIPAKALYEKACVDILSCKNEIEEYYDLKYYCESMLAESVTRTNKRSIFKVVK
jgi:hypothetical protein